MVERAELWVEGTDDAQALASLLRRHRIEIRVKSKASEVGEIKISGSIEKLLEGMKVQISQRRTQPIGFVVDVDIDPEKPEDSIRNRWNSIRNRLMDLGLDCPVAPDVEGTIVEGVVNLVPSKVGIWLMPNNANTGMLEDFLLELVKEDGLLPHAQSATDEAMVIGGRFPAIHRSKAIVHTWLAWQEKPGLPFGTAIKAEYFRHDTESALAFVDWFKRLFQV